MPKKVTLKDIAAKAGLSPASVSMILNRRCIDRFNAETVEQVYTIVAELGYKSSKKKPTPSSGPQIHLSLLSVLHYSILSILLLSRVLKSLPVSRALSPPSAPPIGIRIRKNLSWSRLANSTLPVSSLP